MAKDKLANFKDYLRRMLEEEKQIADALMLVKETEGCWAPPTSKHLLSILTLQQTPEHLNSSLTNFSTNELENNPYLQTIPIPDYGKEWQSGNISIGKSRYLRPGIPVKYGSATRNPQTLKLEYRYWNIDKPILVPALWESDSNTAWMTISPFEIGTFEKIIDGALGDVLLCGCGLAYAAYMMALKPEVTSITIVEQNEDVIKLVKEHIISKMPEEIAKKINIVSGDAIRHLKDNHSKYDYINVDIWYDTPDMIFPYLQCLETELNPNAQQGKTTFTYWYEEQLKNELQRAMIACFCDSSVNFFPSPLIKQLGFDIMNANKSKIKSKEDFKRFINFDFSEMRKMIFNWYQRNKKLVIDKGGRTHQIPNSFKKSIRNMLDEEKALTELLEQIDNIQSSPNILIDLIERCKLQTEIIEAEGVSCKRFPLEQFMKNPYLKQIRIPSELFAHGYQLANKRPIIPGLITPYKIPRINPNTFTIERECCVIESSKEKLLLPALANEGSDISLMTVEPREIVTFEKIIEEAHGDVLLCGCGLAYAAYMIARKPEVTSVTIVDYSQGILDLCNEKIFPQFAPEIRAKITPKRSDAIVFLRKTDLTQFNYINVDIWYDTADMIFTYLPCLEIESKLKKSQPGTQFTYWIEEKLKLQLQLVWLMNISDYPMEPHFVAGYDLIQQIGKDLFKEASDDWTIESFRQFLDIDTERLRKLLLNWYTRNPQTFNKFKQVNSDEEKVANFMDQIGAEIMRQKRNTTPN